MKKRLIILVFLTVAFSTSAQRHEIDSITALLPQLQDEDRLNAMRLLLNLTRETPDERYYVKIFLEEADRQKNISMGGLAWTRLMSSYWNVFDSDSVYIVGEEAMRFTRQHKLYSSLFFTQHQLIRRYLIDGKIITALRKAEEAYEEAKALQEITAIASMQAVIGEIYDTMDIFDEAERYFMESIEMADQNREDTNGTGSFFVMTYYSLMYLNKNRNQLDEMLRYTDSLQVELERFNHNFTDANTDIYSFLMESSRAIAYAKLKQPEPALQAMQRAETLFDPDWNDDFYEAQIDEMYGAYYFALGNYDKALEHQSRFLKYFHDTHGASYMFDAATKDYAMMFLEKGDHKNAALTY